MYDYLISLLECEKFANPETTRFAGIQVEFEGNILSVYSENESFMEFIELKMKKYVVYTTGNFVVFSF